MTTTLLELRKNLCIIEVHCNTISSENGMYSINLLLMGTQMGKRVFILSFMSVNCLKYSLIKL